MHIPFSLSSPHVYRSLWVLMFARLGSPPFPKKMCNFWLIRNAQFQPLFDLNLGLYIYTILGVQGLGLGWELQGGCLRKFCILQAKYAYNFQAPFSLIKIHKKYMIFGSRKEADLFIRKCEFGAPQMYNFIPFSVTIYPYIRFWGAMPLPKAILYLVSYYA